ncbi:MAG: hypothetical protein A3J48_00110 [Candidatus Doudnabacteria bacterium RIFCSPHIGHO2_02_FULL_46_11]|uniref:Uncharacterized protein n=1 Tax=Candidatus Doudnabacteria bacterium RIFCSPHIGHO2_02_FULL_46_11 TaxID=1817832 RepID=A0A1F5P9Y8_9BACT|nr:MAG: hypothetical protein A3J48_00110 [Candidatus Doudnabacteria bacterium RIFCSPHIGHO2_02_FULL_46_11]
MSYEHWLIVLSVAITITGASAYIRDTIKGKTKPNRVSWSMWALAPLVGTAAAISAGADLWVTTRIFLAGFLPLLILASSFVNPQSYWKLTLFDFLCGACALIALGIWLIADLPRMAILLAALGDGFALLPTLRKAWAHPETETGFTYIMSLLSTLLVLPSIQVWNIENSAFQIYLLVANVLLIISIYRKRLNLGWL